MSLLLLLVSLCRIGVDPTTWTCAKPVGYSWQQRSAVWHIQPLPQQEPLGGGTPSRVLRATDARSVSTRATDLKYAASTDYRYGKTSGPSNMSSRNDDMIALENGSNRGMLGF